MDYMEQIMIFFSSFLFINNDLLVQIKILLIRNGKNIHADFPDDLLTNRLAIEIEFNDDRNNNDHKKNENSSSDNYVYSLSNFFS